MTTLTKSGLFWVDTESGEMLDDNDLATLLVALPEETRIRIGVTRDDDDDDDDDDDESPPPVLAPTPTPTPTPTRYRR